MDLCLELVKNGFIVLEAKHLLDIADVNSISFVKTHNDLEENYPDLDSDTLARLLKAIHFQIGLEFVSPYAETYSHTKAVLWEGSLPMHKSWHSDVREEDDIFFLLYFSDQTTTDDGALKFKNTHSEHRFVPKPGLLIGLENTNPEFLHIVEPTVGKRVVGAFGFKVEWKNDHTE